MHILNYRLADPEWFFQLWMLCIFLFWINTIIHVLLKTSIQEIIGCANPKIYWKCQSENLPDFIIRNTKNNKCTVYIGTVLSLRNFVGVQEEKCKGAGRNCHSLIQSLTYFGSLRIISSLHGPIAKRSRLVRIRINKKNNYYFFKIKKNLLHLLIIAWPLFYFKKIILNK